MMGKWQNKELGGEICSGTYWLQMSDNVVAMWRIGVWPEYDGGSDMSL